MTTATSEMAEFYWRYEAKERGYEILPGQEWKGVRAKYQMICPAGHQWDCSAASFTSGNGCRICAGLDPATAEHKWRQLAIKRGYEISPGQEWKGVSAKYQMICPAGHHWECIASNFTKGYECRICAGHDPATAERKWRQIAEERGYVILPGQEWKGAKAKYRMICPAGHLWEGNANNFTNGQGCSYCAGQNHDVLYVVQHETLPLVKFGISSGDPDKRRLSYHRKDGYTKVLRLFTSLPEKVARNTENAVKAGLRDSKHIPAKGTEYFDISALALILDVADGHMAAADAINEAGPEIDWSAIDWSGVIATLELVAA
jgi:hypothetical protein